MKDTRRVSDKILEQYCFNVTRGVLRGLYDHVGILPQLGDQPGHYIPNVRNSSRILVIKLGKLHPDFSHKIVANQNELGQWAGLSDRDSQIRIGWSGRNIILQVPKEKDFWRRVTVDDLSQRRAFRQGHRVALGLDAIDDRPIRLDFAEPDLAHVSIAGQTRSGKTVAERLIAWNLCAHSDRAKTGLIIFDIAKRGYRWGDFGGVDHMLHPVVTNTEEGEQVLGWLLAEMDRRARTKTWDRRIFCFVDELKALVDETKVGRDLISRLVSVGGEFQIHMILATQYPQIKMLGDPALKRNVTTRLCGKVDDAKAAENALGRSGSSAERLLGYGDFLLLRDGFTRLTVADIDASPKHINNLPRGAVHRLNLPDLENVRGTELVSVKLPEASDAGRKNDPLSAEMIAKGLLVLPPMGDRRLSREFKIGPKKASRLNNLLREIRLYAEKESLKCIKFE